MKVAGSGIDNHTDYMLNLFEELVEKKSDGRIQVDYYPNLQLGSIREYYEACPARTGPGGGGRLGHHVELYLQT